MLGNAKKSWEKALKNGKGNVKKMKQSLKKETKSNSDNRFWCWKKSSKNWTRLWNAIYYALLKKTVNIEDYNFE